MATTTARTEPTSTGSGAMEESTQARPTIASDAGPQAMRMGRPVSGYRVGQAAHQDVERDGAEADRDGECEREVGQSEDDRLGDELAEVPADPGRGGDGHGARHDHRAEVADADPGADAAPGPRDRQEDARASRRR